MKLKKVAVSAVALMVFVAAFFTVLPNYMNTTNSSAVSVSAATYLQLNSTGSQVKTLQNNLISLGYLSSGSATGTYNSKTQSAVKSIQSAYGLTSDGIAGPKTLTLVSNLVSGSAKVIQVTGSNVNIRSGAGTSYKKVTVASKNQKYTYTDTKTVSGKTWYKINVKNTTGWIIGTYVKVVNTGSSTTTTAKATTTTAVSSSSGTLKVTGSRVNVRSGAGTSYSVIKTVTKGSSYSYSKVATVNGTKWYYIKLSSSSSGWIIGTYVSATASTTTTTKATTTTTKATTTTTKATTTTTKATTTTTKATTTTTKASTTTATTTKVAAVATSATNTTTKATTTTTKATTTTTKATTTTTKATTTTTTASSNSDVRQVLTGTVTASTLNVRKSASTSATVLGTLKKGATVVIVSKGSSWHKIEYGSGYGYVSASYISNIAYTYEAVSLSYSTTYNYVDVGSTIDLSIDVSGATITYSSSNSTNCPISSSGIVTGKSAGLYTITATCGSSSATTYVVVMKAAYTGITAMTISEKGTNFIAEWEGGGTVVGSETRFYPYQDVSGYWTIGYGHCKSSTASLSWSEEKAISELNKDITSLIGSAYVMTDDKPYITAEAALKLLNADLNQGTYVSSVSNWAIRNGVKLTQNQFDALVSFAYNMGTSYFTSDSTKIYLKSAILAYRSGSDADSEQIIYGFCLYYKASGKNLSGLWYRRRNEAEMFIDGDYTLDRSNKFTLPTNISWYS